jgi:hypothetical protein
MQKRTVERSSSIVAPREAVYALLADYRSGHPRILPPRYFTPLIVVEGGVGEGTRIRVGMKAFGKIRQHEAVVLEPEPGRLLVETTLTSKIVTSFYLESLDYGGTQVTISTRIPIGQGLLAELKWAMTRWFLERVYAEELRLLGETLGKTYVGSGNGGGGAESGYEEVWYKDPGPPWLEESIRSRFAEAP